MIKQILKIVPAKQPTIAVITAHYCEKLVIDAMMDDQDTFVHYTTVGVYFFVNHIYPFH